MSKGNYELYAELSVMLKKVDADVKKIMTFAEENKLIFNIIGAKYIPKSDEIRSPDNEDMVPTEDEEPSEDYGYYPQHDRGTLWISSNCY